MALVANRFERKILDQFPAPPDLGHGAGSVLIESEFWDHPGGAYSLLIKQTKTSTDHNNRLVSRELDEFVYEELDTKSLTRHHKEIWANVWLPQVCRRGLLTKVEEHWTIYWTNSIFCDGARSHRTVKSGYVIVDLMPTEVEPADITTKLTERGQKIPAAATRNITDSMRPWSAALQQSAVVEEESAPQKAVWFDPWEVEEEIVEDDTWRTVRWRWRKDYTVAGPPEVEGPIEDTKEVTFQDTVTLGAPGLIADSGAPDGIMLTAAGGGGKVKMIWPKELTLIIQPDSYSFYRKVVSRPPSEDVSGDPYGIYETPPLAPSTYSALAHTDVADYAGDPADPLPAQTAYSESEDSTPPDGELWTHIGDGANIETDRTKPGRAYLNDTDVAADYVYEYYCIARVRDSESPESNHATASVGGGYSASGIPVRVRVKASSKSAGGLTVAAAGEAGSGSDVAGVSWRESGLEVEAFIPKDPGVQLTTPTNANYGETEVYTVPIAVESLMGGGTIDIQTPIDSALELGQAIGLRQAIRDRKRAGIRFTPTAVLLNLERGQRFMMPNVTCRTWGNALRLDTELAALRWRVEGFGFTARRAEDGSFVATPDQVEGEETGLGVEMGT